VKNGKIVGIGKAGNPDIMDGVTENMIVGSSTEVRAPKAVAAVDPDKHHQPTPPPRSQTGHRR
jgi:urease alpha subunit